MKYIIVAPFFFIAFTANSQGDPKDIGIKNFNGYSAYTFKNDSAFAGYKTRYYSIARDDDKMSIYISGKEVARFTADSFSRATAWEGDRLKFFSRLLVGNTLDSLAVASAVFTHNGLAQLQVLINGIVTLDIDAKKGWHCTNHTNPVHKCSSVPAFASPPCETKDCVWQKD
jgi:hypothetical protein